MCCSPPSFLSLSSRTFLSPICCCIPLSFSNSLEIQVELDHDLCEVSLDDLLLDHVPLDSKVGRRGSLCSLPLPHGRHVVDMSYLFFVNEKRTKQCGLVLQVPTDLVVPALFVMT